MTDTKTEKKDEKNQKETFAEFCKRTSGVSSGDVCRWGSSQYASAQAVYDTMKTDTKSSETLARYGVKIELGKQVETPAAIKSITDHLNTRYSEEQGAFQTTDFKDVDQIFHTLCGESWDLWSAIPMVFKYIYPDARIEVEKVVGKGPVLNQIAQSNNNMIGLQAWILTREKIIRDDNCLLNFDT